MNGVTAQYGDILDSSQARFADDVSALSSLAARLLVRLISRKGPWIRVDSLRYREVPNVSDVLEELRSLGFIDCCADAPADRLLMLLTLDELRELFPHAPRTSPKSTYIDHLVCRYTDRAVRARLRSKFPWVRLTIDEPLAHFQLMFFGDAYQDLSAFVMRDLGLTRFESYELKPERRLFADRAALEGYLDLVALGKYVGALGDRPPLEFGIEPLRRLWQPMQHRTFERKRSRILNRLGRGLERTGAFDLALTCYARSTLAPARERRARILRRLGDEAAVEGLKQKMIDAPRAALERDFAQRFGGVRRRCDLPITDLGLREPARAHIEQVALSMLTANRGVGWHLENQLPMALFGLAYWEWVFAPVDGMFVNAFQTGPMDLFWPDFFATRQSMCADPLALPDGDLAQHMKATARAKFGITNRLVNWSRMTLERIETILSMLPEQDIRQVLRIVTHDLERARTGFPDLTLVYGCSKYEFVEVKGPGDQLQSHQILWIQALREHNLPVRVVRLRC
ncbi:MAG: VRR-NUC domain-containing protein [Gammaproteobacteria bacterium]|nr:VRR-NUC domain-containing protein [Gammaproteobacteria bacterium]